MLGLRASRGARVRRAQSIHIHFARQTPAPGPRDGVRGNCESEGQVSTLEERQAWDLYAAVPTGTTTGTAEWADRMLVARRKRFGPSVPPASCTYSSAQPYTMACGK